MLRVMDGMGILAALVTRRVKRVVLRPASAYRDDDAGVHCTGFNWLFAFEP